MTLFMACRVAIVQAERPLLGQGIERRCSVRVQDHCRTPKYVSGSPSTKISAVNRSLDAVVVQVERGTDVFGTQCDPNEETDRPCNQ